MMTTDASNSATILMLKKELCDAQDRIKQLESDAKSAALAAQLRKELESNAPDVAEGLLQNVTREDEEPDADARFFP